MNDRVAKHWRKYFRKRYKFDRDAFINEVIELPFGFRLKLCYHILFRSKVHGKKAGSKN